ncbi:protein of unknown function [Moritella yayanosii]|uniref:Uncharacterized protein n=1 Tax=Moritella yayanosii TaxID=69539 RepID=A0A330LUE4_9GAMM|nr:protein of unknown function [Moritella yayanosii]
MHLYCMVLIYIVLGMYNYTNTVNNSALVVKFNQTSHAIVTSRHSVICVTKIKCVSMNKTIILSY